MTVAEALNYSHEAHERYRDNLPRRVANGNGGTVPVPGDAEVAGQALSEALRFRAEAHAMDPAQVDPAWRADGDHHVMLTFYVDQLTRN